MGKHYGKIFEEDIKASIPPEVYVERYKDDTAGFKGVDNPADFRLYTFPYSILIECKSHKGVSLPLSKIRKNQIEGLKKAVQYKGIYGGFLINYRDYEETYYVPVEVLDKFISAGSRKSIPLSWCRLWGQRIEQRKKITRYSYDLEKWLRSVCNGTE